MGCGDGGCVVYMCACVHVSVRVCVFACEVVVCVPWQEVGLQQSNVRVMSLMTDPRHSRPRSPHLKAECLLASLMH